MFGRFALLGLCIGIAGSSAHAQSAPSPQTAPASPGQAAPPADDQGIALGEAERRMTVPVRIGEKGPFDFVVDTGAERSVVSRELAATLGLQSGSPARLFDFTGESTTDTVRVPSLSVGGLGGLAIEAPALDRQNLGAAGMLGIDALQGQKVSIDFARNRMTLKLARRHPSGQILVEAEMRVGQLIVTNAFFDGQPISVIVDTGTWVSVGNSAMRALTSQHPRVLGPMKVVSVTGRSFDADYVAVNDVKIGGVGIDNFGMIFADVPPFKRFGLADKPALILGMSSLKLFERVEIDFANREIAFTLPRPPINFLSLCNGVSMCKSL